MTVRLNGHSEIESWSLTRDAVPRTVADSAGVKTANITESTRHGEVSPLHRFEKEATLEVSIATQVSGLVSNLTQTGDFLSYSITDLFDVLNIDRTVRPFHGTFQGAVESILGDVGYPLGTLIFASLPPMGDVTLPGGFGNAWKMFTDFLAMHDVDILDVQGFTLFSYRHTPGVLEDYFINEPALTEVPSTTIARNNPTRYINVSYFNHEYVTDGEVYPPNILEAPIIQVEAGETVETEIQLSAWLRTVNQPECIDFVGATPGEYDNTNGVYSVAGSDGLPVTPAQWAGTGGTLTVELTERPDVAKVTITGPSVEELSPYRIAMSSGNYYSSLRVTGEGVRHKQETLRFPTGADPDLTTQEDGPTITSNQVGSLSDALKVAQWEADRNGGVDISMGYSADLENDLRSSSFLYGNARWRVKTENYSTTGVSRDCERFTTLGDFEDAWAGKTLGDFEDAWAGGTLGDMQLYPLAETFDA